MTSCDMNMLDRIAMYDKIIAEKKASSSYWDKISLSYCIKMRKHLIKKLAVELDNELRAMKNDNHL